VPSGKPARAAVEHESHIGAEVCHAIRPGRLPFAALRVVKRPPAHGVGPAGGGGGALSRTATIDLRSGFWRALRV